MATAWRRWGRDEGRGAGDSPLAAQDTKADCGHGVIAIRYGILRLLPVLALGLSCGDAPTTEPTPPVSPVATTVVVTPETVVFTALQETSRLTAEVRDQQGRPMSGVAVAWASSDPSVAAVDQTGLARAVSAGTASITASAGSASGAAQITVRQEVASVAVEPRTASLVVGDTLRLSAEARDANANAISGNAFLWSSDRADVVTVDSTGLARARSSGEATIAATAAGVTGSATLTVAPSTIPPNYAVDEGTSHTLQAIGRRLPHGRIRRGRSGTSHSVVYADLDQDGDTDLFYAPLNRTLNPLPPEVHLNDGSYNFHYVPGFLGQDAPSTVHARKALTGDFNGDSRPDIFVLASGYDVDPFPGESNYVLLSSDEGYVPGVGLDSIVGYHHGGASADVDADGDLDVFVTENFKGPFFLLNDGDGNFRKDMDRIQDINYEAGIYTAELVDVDQDGYVDLLVAGHEYTGFRTQVLWGSESGIYSSVRATLLPLVLGNGVVVDIDVADTDGDGDRDVVVNRTGDPSGAGFYDGYYMQLLSQTGSRSFADVTASHLVDNQDLRAEWFDWIRVYDMNDDGDLDIVVDDVESFATRGARDLFWENDGSGRFTRVGGPRRPIPPNPNADAGSSHTRQYAGLRVDHSALRSSRPGWVTAIAYADFDLDGDVDVFHAPLVESGEPQPVEFHINDGNNGFSLQSGLLDGPAPRVSNATKAVSGDYNGDGRADVLVVGAGSSHGNRETYLILSSATGYRLGAGLDDLAGTHYAATSADMDADGDLDVFLPGTYGAAMLVGLNDGQGAFTEWPVLEQDAGFVLAAEWVDLDRDGYVDLLLGGHEHEDSDTRVLWGDSTGAYTDAHATIIPKVTGNGVVRDIDAGDIDGDGDRDLVVTRTGDGTGALDFYQGYHLQLLEQRGPRRFNDATAAALTDHRDPEAGSINWVRVFDADGDGDLDILVDDYWPRGFLWENDGSGTFVRVRAP